MTHARDSDWRPTAARDALVRRGALVATIRDFFAERGVLEVHTPLLAADGVTDPCVESIQVPGAGYLQTSPEYLMKRLLSAGSGDIYQLASVFRAGESGRLHNPEFTMLEWYRLGFDDADLRTEVAALVDRVLGPDGYQTVTYHTLISASQVMVPSGWQDREMLDLAFANAVDALPPGRYFIVDYPADQAMLARRRVDDPGVAARFELIVDGVELANGYFELGDPAELRERFVADNLERAHKGLAQVPLDEAFLAAMGAGMPDCAGVALGVDRLIMLALGAQSLSAVMAFGNGL